MTEWKMLPKEPTREMYAAGGAETKCRELLNQVCALAHPAAIADGRWQAAYTNVLNAMLAAAPPAPADAEVDDLVKRLLALSRQIRDVVRDGSIPAGTQDAKPCEEAADMLQRLSAPPAPADAEVERVAMAMRDVDGPHWEEAPRHIKDSWRRYARAAIAAIGKG